MKFAKKQCYVFVNLPDQVEPVLAGRVSLVSLEPNSYSEFIYGKSYLANKNAIAFDPINLPLIDKKFFSNIPGMFGVIRDAMPDSWGRFIIEKRTQNLSLSEVDYLLLSKGERVGALNFEEEKELINKKPTYAHSVQDLKELLSSIEEINSANNEMKDSLVDLINFGSSMGGARPKIVVEDNDDLWLAKFNRKDDKINYCRVEYANMLLAKKCKINIPDVKLVSIKGKDIYLIKRFDRKKDIKTKKYFKNHFLSALTLTGRTEMESGKASYQELASLIRQVCLEPEAELKELFKRMVFNVVCLNADDHLRNHGFLYNNGTYNLSPAYDIVPMPQMSYTKTLSLNIGKHGKTASINNILTAIDAFGLSQIMAKNIIDEQLEICKTWKEIFIENGVSSQDIKLLTNCFDKEL